MRWLFKVFVNPVLMALMAVLITIALVFWLTEDAVKALIRNLRTSVKKNSNETPS